MKKESTASLVKRLESEAKAESPVLDITAFNAPVPVTDEETFAHAAAKLNQAKDTLKGWKEEAVFYGTKSDPGSITLAHAAHAKLMAAFNKIAKPLQLFIDKQDAVMAQYRTQQRQIAAQEEAKRQQVIDQQFEQARAESEAKAAEAEKLRRDGFVKEAQRLVSTPIVMAPVETPASPRTAGLIEKFPWDVRVVSVMDLLRAIADGKIPLTYNERGEPEDLLVVNMPLAKALAKRYDKDLNIPGLESFESVSFGKARS